MGVAVTMSFAAARQFALKVITELYSYDFEWMRVLERSRLRGAPNVPAVKIYDALEKRLSDITTDTMHAIMRELGCPCDEGDGERCLVVRVVEVDEDTNLIVDDHPSEG